MIWRYVLLGRLAEAEAELSANTRDAAHIHANTITRLLSRQHVSLSILKGSDHNTVSRALSKLALDLDSQAGLAEAAEIRLSLVNVLLAAGKPTAEVKRWLNEAEVLLSRHSESLGLQIKNFSLENLTTLDINIQKNVWGYEKVTDFGNGLSGLGNGLLENQNNPLSPAGRPTSSGGGSGSKDSGGEVSKVVPPTLIGLPYNPGLSYHIELALRKAAWNTGNNQISMALRDLNTADRLLKSLIDNSPLAQASLDQQVGPDNPNNPDNPDSFLW